MLSTSGFRRIIWIIPSDFWTLGREHLRVTLHDSRFVKLTLPHGYPEPLETPLVKEGANGAMKSCAKNMVRAA